MNADRINLRDLFGRARRLAVPLFQRPYVWTEEQQWGPLFEDVRALAERRESGKPLRPHFLGAIVLDQQRTPTSSLEERLVVDGQQRLTTLQLLLAALRDHCSSLEDIRLHQAFTQMTDNDDPMSREEHDRFKVWPTTVDQRTFCTTMTAGSREALWAQMKVKHGKRATGALIADAYLFFREALDGWLKDVPTACHDQRLGHLLEVLRIHVQIVVIDLANDDDAQAVFETLNARGTPLLPTDLVKNHLFHLAEVQQLPLQQLYEQFWKPFDDNPAFWREPIRQGRLKRPLVDMFLQHFVTMHTTEEVKSHYHYGAIRDYTRSAGGNAETILKDLRAFADVYERFWPVHLVTPLDAFFQRLRDLDTTTFHPALLRLFHSYPEPEHEQVLLRVARTFESFLVRRTICGLTTKQYNRLGLDLLPALTGESGDPVSVVQRFFLDREGDSVRWPSDEEFERAWLYDPVYRRLTRPRLRMMLNALDAAMRGPKTEPIALGNGLPVEHLLPQRWQEHWHPPTDASAEARVRRESLLHSFGNLTLVTQALNSAVSNGAWIPKRNAILEHSALSLNRGLRRYDDWNEERILERGREMFAVALQLWPRPL